jgi:hypothetical protein
MQPPWPTAVARRLLAAVGILQPPSATVVAHSDCPTAVAYDGQN